MSKWIWNKSYGVIGKSCLVVLFVASLDVEFEDFESVAFCLQCNCSWVNTPKKKAKKALKLFLLEDKSICETIECISNDLCGKGRKI